MKKKISFLVSLLIVSISLQKGFENQDQSLTLRLEELVVVNLSTHKQSDIIYQEGLMDGPYLNFKCSITNTSENEMTIYPANSKVSVSFSYLGKVYRSEIFPHIFLEESDKKLLPDESISFEAGRHIFLNTPILRNQPSDYCSTILEIFPTISIRYLDRTIGVKLEADHVLKVKLE